MDDNLDTMFQESIAEFNDKWGMYFSVPSICTTTITCKLTRQPINLDDIRNNKDLSIRTKRGKRAKTYRSFFNSVTVIFDKKKTVKVFCNGTLHITGCSSIGYAKDIIRRLIENMCWKDTSIDSLKILTLNTTLALNPKRVISLDTCHRILVQKNINARYTPDVYQGLIIKAPCPTTNKVISFLCFYTGSFIVSGVTQPCELSFGLNFLASVFDDMKKYIF